MAALILGVPPTVLGFVLALSGNPLGALIILVGDGFGRALGRLPGGVALEVALLLTVYVALEYIFRDPARQAYSSLPLLGAAFFGLLALVLTGSHLTILYGAFFGSLAGDIVRVLKLRRRVPGIFWVAGPMRLLALYVASLWLVLALT